MNTGPSKQQDRKKRLAKALRDNLRKRRAKERQLQPKEKKPGQQVKN